MTNPTRHPGPNLIFQGQIRSIRDPGCRNRGKGTHLSGAPWIWHRLSIPTKNRFGALKSRRRESGRVVLGHDPNSHWVSPSIDSMLCLGFCFAGRFSGTNAHANSAVCRGTRNTTSVKGTLFLPNPLFGFGSIYIYIYIYIRLCPGDLGMEPLP